MSNQRHFLEGAAALEAGFEALRQIASPKVWARDFRSDLRPQHRWALEALGQKLAAEATTLAVPRRPQFSMDAARRQWEEYLVTGDARRVEPRAVRRLCSEVDVAVREEFGALLLRYDRPPSKSMLRDLLAVYHATFNERHSELARYLGTQLRDYRGHSHLLTRLAAVADEVVGEAAASRAARKASSAHATARQFLDELGLAANTPYALAVGGELIDVALRQLERTRDPDKLRDVCEQLIPAHRDLLIPRAFSGAVQRLVTFAASGDPSLRETVKSFVLLEPRLGDPRQHPDRWDNVGLSEHAEIVKGWLSEEDLRFFFDLIMKDQEDRHQRRDFWINYVHRVRNSRVAVGMRDRERLRVQLEDMKKRGRTYGLLEDWNVSAFVMDFGPAVAIEFSRVGACNIYDAKAAHEKIGDLGARKFSPGKLKMLRGSPGWFRHDRNGYWMSDVRQLLARFGVRD